MRYYSQRSVAKLDFGAAFVVVIFLVLRILDSECVVYIHI